MSRALLTVNFSGALCRNSRMSMESASERWGAEYLELNERNRPPYRVSPACFKCFVWKLTKADEAFILDADIVVSAACPNPFETFIGPELIAVRNGSPERFGDYWQIKNCERYEWDKLAMEEFRVAGIPWMEGRYWNSGVLLARRRAHEAMFALAADIVQMDHGLGWNDQTPLNMASIATLTKVALMGEEWNYIHPSDLGVNWMDMHKTGKYIYHGAGETGREHWLPLIKWQSPSVSSR